MNTLVNCPICLDMIEDALETPCCHNIFCEKCIIRTDTCPICTSKYDLYQLTPNIPMRRLINEIVIQCPNEGCEVQCTKANLQKHNETCLFEEVSCPNGQCAKKLLRKDLEEHVEGECEHRIIDCILNCGTRIKLNALYDHIHRICPKALIPCKNNCGEVVERGGLIYHVNSKCKNEVIACLYKQTLIYQNGCDIKLKRGDMPDHLAQCPFRITKCNNSGCSKKIAFKDTQKHDSECPYKVITCKNNCGSTFERKFEEEHLEHCDLQMIKCPYHEMGCHVEILRKDNLSHLESEAFAHSIMFINGQNKKNEELENLKTELNRVKEMFSEKIDFLYKAMNQHEKEEEKQPEPKFEHLPDVNKRANLNNFKLSTDSNDDEEDMEEYIDDEFESDYSFGFRN